MNQGQRIQVASGSFAGHFGVVLEEPNRQHPDLHIVRLDQYLDRPEYFTSDRLIEAPAIEVPLIVKNDLPFDGQPEEEEEDEPTFDDEADIDPDDEDDADEEDTPAFKPKAPAKKRR